MKNILIIGAGRSATALINYMLDNAAQKGWFITVADADPNQASQKVNNHPNGRPTWLDVTKVNDRRELLERMDIVLSLLPANLHLEVAHDCIRLKKQLISASHITKELYRLGDEARDRELIFMGEMGLDPGVDHMSAMKLVDDVKLEGGELVGFRSFTGGLVAPESDTNPWHYKFSWNPRNVVLMGQGTGQYLENGKYKYIPYNRLFELYEEVEIDGIGKMEMIVNRDSLLYRDIYGLGEIPSLVRGTLRHPGFCDAWHALVKLGLTDGAFPILESNQLTYHGLMESFLGPIKGNGSVKERVADFLGESPNSKVMKKLEWLGLFSKRRIKMKQATPALLLEDLLVQKWSMGSGDKDMVVMQHELEYKLNGEHRRRKATMILKGSDERDTAMSRMVGLPMGIFTNMVVEGKIKSKGIQIPVMREVYLPVLEALKSYGIHFVEKDEIL